VPYDPIEDRFWSAELRLTDLEDRISDLEGGPFMCPLCTTPYNTKAARDHCDCDDD